MNEPITDVAQLHASLAPEVAARVRLAAAGLDPATIDEIVNLILQYGPTIWMAVLSLFKVTPKS